MGWGSGGTAPEWHALSPCILARVYSPVEDSQNTRLVFLQSDIFEIIKFPDNAHMWNWAARADRAGLLPRMSRYPRSRSTADHTSFHISCGMAGPQSLQTHITLMRDIKLNKILRRMTETASITFMADSFLVFKNLQLVLEITCGRSCELWVAPKWKMFSVRRDP